MSNILLETLKNKPLICAEGYLFEMERRGYLTSGEFVPEVACLLYTSPSPRDRQKSRMPSSA